MAAGPLPKTRRSLLSVHGVEIRGRKPPLQTYFVRLSVKNRRNHSVWYILPYYGDKSLPQKGAFQARTPWNTTSVIAKASSGDQHGGKGTFRTVAFLGAERPVSHSFIAFVLPAGGHLQHDFFPIDAWTDITAWQVWEASALQVNGKTPLEVWLPYEVLTDKETYITRQAALSTDHDAFQWKPGRSSNDFPAEEVKTIVPTILTKRRLFAGP